MDELDGAQRQKKHEIRRSAHARRDGQADPESVSLRIFDQFVRMPEYRASRTVLTYVSFHSEVATGQFMATARADGKCLAVPYCVGDRLELFRLADGDELAPGTLGILEPREELRGRADRRLGPGELDLIVVPGLAFDPQCGRVGYGKGYYDRLLRQISPQAAAVAVAFHCQIFPEVPVLAYDARVDKVVTETAVYQRSRPRFDGTVI